MFCPHCGKETGNNNEKTGVQLPAQDQGSFAFGFWMTFGLGIIGLITSLAKGGKNTYRGAIVASILYVAGDLLYDVIDFFLPYI